MNLPQLPPSRLNVLAQAVKTYGFSTRDAKFIPLVKTKMMVVILTASFTGLTIYSFFGTLVGKFEWSSFLQVSDSL